MNMIVSAAAVGSSVTLAELGNEHRLCELESQILAEYEAANAHDDEIVRLRNIWGDEYERLHTALKIVALSEGRAPTKEERDAIKRHVKVMPEAQDFDRLVDLVEEHFWRIDTLTKEMWHIPATTAAGRRAKMSVFFVTIAHKNFQDSTVDADYDVDMVRRLLFEFAGKEASCGWVEYFERDGVTDRNAGEGEWVQVYAA